MKNFEQEYPTSLNTILSAGGTIAKITRCIDNFFYENTKEDFEKFKKEISDSKKHNRMDFMSFSDALEKILRINEGVLEDMVKEVSQPDFKDQNAKLMALEFSKFINFYKECPYADDEERVLLSRDFFNLAIPLLKFSLGYAEREMDTTKALVSSLSGVVNKQTYLDVLKTGELINQHVKTASAYGAYTYTKGISVCASFNSKAESNIDEFLKKIIVTTKDHFLLTLPYDKESCSFTILFNTDTEKSEKISRNKMEQVLESIYENENMRVNFSTEVDTPVILAEAFNKPIKEIAQKVQYKKEASQSGLEM